MGSRVGDIMGRVNSTFLFQSDEGTKQTKKTRQSEPLALSSDSWLSSNEPWYGVHGLIIAVRVI